MNPVAIEGPGSRTASSHYTISTRIEPHASKRDLPVRIAVRVPIRAADLLVLKGVGRLIPSPASRRCRSRSEEHTSELQSLAYLVCRLLLEKKKKKRSFAVVQMVVFGDQIKA